MSGSPVDPNIPGGGTISTPETGDKDNNSGSGWSWNPLKWLTDLLKDIVEGIIKTIWKLITSLFGFLLWLLSLVGKLFPFIPGQAVLAVTSAVVIVAVIRIIKFITGGDTMKKICALLALLCVLVCTTCPVFADEVTSDISTAETAQAGDDMAGATTDSADALTNLMNGVKEKWDELFGGLEGVLEFTTVCVGGSIGCLPSSFGVYLIMLCVCIAVVAIFKALGGKDK